ncbi:MAG TPA: serine/threonine-protein kinase [Thermoanaerobaculia bacterium]|nr:serine/threonine-protein kinase [Thermoanaerobaculia bacterium]
MPHGQTALAGAVLDAKYRLTHLLGQGGMGAVYRAQHLGTGRPVAVKVLLSELVQNPEAVERFRREARAAGGLRHPNVVDVTDFGVARVDGREIAYLTMEYLEGSSLRAMLDQRGALPLEVVADIVEQIAAALEASHGAGIVHRDLKPDNVWLVHDGRGGFAVRVLDFGIARLGQDGAPPRGDEALSAITAVNTPTMHLAATDEATALRPADREPAPAAAAISSEPAGEESTARLTTAGSLIGTPFYMSPEQCRGFDVDASTDIYSLGVLTWEMLAGRRPFRGNLRQVMDAHLHASPPPLDTVAPAVSAVVERAMAKTPQERYESARAFAGCLRAAAEGPGAIIRRSMALYADRFSEFLRISAHVARPPVLVVAALLAISAAVALLAPDQRAAVLPLNAGVLFAPLLWLVITMLTNATYAVAIERLRTRPLERLDPEELTAEVRERLGLPRSAGYATTARRLLGYYLRCELRAKAGTGDLAFLIGFLEGVPIAEIPPRSAALAAGSRRAYRRVAGGIFAALLALPLLEAGVLALVLRPLGEMAIPLAMLIAITLVPFNAMLVNPIFSSALALLYFRARQAQGEDVALAAVLPGRL